jgi:hypothetical protein
MNVFLVTISTTTATLCTLKAAESANELKDRFEGYYDSLSVRITVDPVEDITIRDLNGNEYHLVNLLTEGVVA